MQNLFSILFFFVPIFFLPFTSELFEFNKMIFVYIMATLVMAVWLSRCLVAKKFIFRRTPLDIPLLIFLGSQILSTIFSIDHRTSLLGYYSRFNGGLLSVISYSLLYWAYVANMNRKSTLKTLYSVLCSAVIVSVYGVLQHFGIDKDVWVQDVQNRVFSTLGQPNWLATYLVALMPLAWCNLISKFKFSISLAFSILLFMTLLFTKSRSGLLGFIFADIIFWGYVLSKFRKKFLKEFLIINFIFLVLFFIFKTPITYYPPPLTSTAPALEVGGTESGTIRKIVWKGALQVWLHYPIVGSGPETFAYSYYQFRPVEHNLVSEWDFLYNKAHNEYLNFLATSGSIGLLSYLIVIGSSLFIFSKKFQFSVFNFQSNSNLKISKNENSVKIDNYKLLIAALGAGYSGLLISNFFGFSTVATQLEFFLFPAMAVTLTVPSTKYTIQSKQKTSNLQKLFIFLILCTMLYVLSTILRYWYADVLYAKGKSLTTKKNYPLAQKTLEKAIRLSGNEAIFHGELSLTYADDTLFQFGLKKPADQSIERAIEESNKAITLSPANLNLLRGRASLFLKLAIINPKYLGGAKDALLLATSKAPTDAKILYSLGLTYARTGEKKLSLGILKKAIDLKPNYRDARLAYALMLVDQGDIPEAKDELKYILEKINPDDAVAKEQLKKLQ